MVVVVVGFSIYLTQQNRQLSADVTAKNAQIATLQEQQTTPPPTTTPAKPTTSPQSDIVTISKWGIQFQPTSALTDTQVKYYARTSNDSPPQEYYGFSTARVEALGGGCTTLPLGDIVILQRSTDRPIATPDGQLISSSPIGGYYYVATGPIAPCKSDQISIKAVFSRNC